MTEPLTLLRELQEEAETAAKISEDRAGPSGDSTATYWRGRADGIAYAIRELEAAKGDAPGSLAEALQRDHERHRTADTDLVEAR